MTTPTSTRPSAEPTSAEMHRAYAKDLRWIAVVLAAVGMTSITVSIFAVTIGVNAALVLALDGVGLVIACAAAFPWMRAVDENRYARMLDDGSDEIIDRYEQWRLMDHKGARLDGCRCTMCKALAA